MINWKSRLLCVLFSIFTFLAIVISSIELTAYGDMNFYKTEYEKYNVLDTVGMSMNDLMDVTREMMSYLHGNRADLVIETTINGEKREFFNEREKLHMADVRQLLLNALRVRNLSAAAALILLLSGLFLHKKTLSLFLSTLFRSILATFAGILIFILLAGLIVSRNFTYYWTIFHEIFFTNDLWLLDPATDLLINIVPEGFFMDFVFRAACITGTILLAVLGSSGLYLLYQKFRRSHHPVICLFMVFLLGGLFSFSSPVQGAESNPSLEEVEDTLSNLPSTGVWADFPEISAKNAIVMEATTGTVLYARNATSLAYPASMTKIMTALLALENSSLEDEVYFSSVAVNLPAGSSHIGMRSGEILSMENALYGLLLPSANEVANAIAETIGGSIDNFVALMNERATELGAVRTHFANPSGLHDVNHYTTAYDIAKIYAFCVQNETFLQISQTTNYVIPATNLVSETRPVQTTNKFLLPSSPYYNENVISGKTGTTNEAGSCLVTYSQKNGLSLIIVVMGEVSPAQYTDTAALMEYTFSNFMITTIEALDTEYASGSNLSLSPLQGSDFPSFIALENNSSLVIPQTATLEDLTKTISQESGSLNEGNYSGLVTYSWDDYVLAETGLKSNALALSQMTPHDTDTYPADQLESLPIITSFMWKMMGIGLLLLILLTIGYIRYRTDPRYRYLHRKKQLPHSRKKNRLKL